MLKQTPGGPPRRGFGDWQDWMVLIGVVAFVFVLAFCVSGCNATIGPKGIRGGGDSDQEVLTIDGKGTIDLDPATGKWSAECKTDNCSLKWITQAQQNAQRDVDLVNAAGDLAIKAMKSAVVP